MDYNKIEVSLFSSIADKNPKRINLIELLELFKSNKYKSIVEKIRNEPDEGRRKMLKAQLPGFTPSAICEGGHAIQNFVSHTGLLFFDFDYKDNESAKNFKDLPELAKEFPFILYLGRSVGGKGFHALIPIADIDRDNHKAYYTAICKAFESCGLIPDKAASDITRLCYVSYDPDPYFNPNAEPLDLDEAFEDQQTEQRGSLEPDPAITDPYETYIEIARLIERAEIRKAERYHDKAAAHTQKAEEAEPKTDNAKDEDKKVIKKNIADFAEEYPEWRDVAFAFALTFGDEMGRPLFHAYSELSGKYDHAKVDEQFDIACRNTLNKLNSGTPRKGLIAIGSFFKLCQEYELIPSSKMATIEEDFKNVDLRGFTEEPEEDLSAEDDDL